MFNILIWISAGAVLGLLLALVKFSASYSKSLKIIKDTPTNDRINRAQAIGYNRGLFYTALSISSLVGGGIGLVAWGLVAVIRTILA